MDVEILLRSRQSASRAGAQLRGQALGLKGGEG